MAPIYTPVSAIVAGKANLKLKVRIFHMWNVTDKHKRTDIVSMNMLLMDEKRDRIHLTVRKDLVPTIKEMVEEGSAYEVENILVAGNDKKYRVTNHKYKLNCKLTTKFTKISSPQIPVDHFDFMAFQDILSSSEEEKIADVIGHVIEKSNIKEYVKDQKSTKLMDLTLEDLECNRIHCTLWEDFAEKVNTFFEKQDSSRTAIMILQTCQLKKHLGIMGISTSWYGTKLILNGDIAAVRDYQSRMDCGEVSLTQGVSQITGHVAVPLADDLLKSQRMTIEELIDAPEPCSGSVLATVCEIETGNTWYYQSCTGCTTGVSLKNGQLSCEKCGNGVTAVPRFKLNIVVMDDSGSTTFVLFDRAVSQFLGRSVGDLIAEFNQRIGSEPYPPDFNMFLDKQMLFKVEVSKGNVSKRYKRYAVKRATDDASVIQKFITLHNVQVCTQEDDTEYSSALINLADNSPVRQASEYIDSTNDNDDGVVLLTDCETPNSKCSGKRSALSMGSLVDSGESSATKSLKFSRVGQDP